MAARFSTIAVMVATLSLTTVATPETAQAGSLVRKCVKTKLKAAGRHTRDLAKCLSTAAVTNDLGIALDACIQLADAAAVEKINSTTINLLFEDQSCIVTAEDLLLTGTGEWFEPFVALDLFPPANVLPNQCVSRKIAAIGKYAEKLGKCASKDYVRPDPAKLAKCDDKTLTKLQKNYASADNRGPCAGTVADAVAGIAAAQLRTQLEVLRFGPQIIDLPVNGTCTTDPTISVSGRHLGAEPVDTVTLNGIPQTLDPVTFVFTDDVSVDPGEIFNPITAIVTTTSGDVRKDRVTAIAGDGVTSGCVADGELSPESIAMHLNESGLDSIVPLVSSLAGGALDIGPVIQAGNPVLDDECVFFIGALCGYWATVNIVDVGFSDFGIAIDPKASGVTQLDVSINDFDVDIDLHVRDCCAVNFDCGLTISADAITISSDYDMVPNATTPSKVDVNQTGALDLSFDNFSHQFTSGICDDPLIGDIIDSLVGGTLQDLVSDGFSEALVDPDGAGPADSPIAEGIETALDGIDIAGPVGQAIGVNMQAEFSSIEETDDGITFRVDAGVTATEPHPFAPDLPDSYTVAETFPTYGTTTPVGGMPYGVALGLSSSAFNQLLRAQVESGLLRADITEFDLGAGPVLLDVGLLQLFIPELFGEFSPSEEVVVEIRPGMSPVFTGAPGPAGELSALEISHLAVDLRIESSGFRIVGMIVDAAVGVDLVIDPSGVGFALGAPDPGDIEIDIVDNPLDANETAMQNTIGALLPAFFPQLAGALDGLPLPAFLGLELDPVEVSKQGEFITVFTNLVAAP